MLNPNNSGLFNRLFISVISNNAGNEKVKWLDRTNKERKCKNRKKLQFPDKEVATEMSETLHNIFELCRVNNIRLYGLKFPLTAVYIDVLDGASYHADSVFLANALPILNYKEIFKDNDSLFMDQDHLNQEGAVRFIKLLSNDLETQTLSAR